MYDWSRYAVGGAAARPDSFTGLDPDFASAIWRLTQDAHAAGYPLQITSAYRSPDVQARLYEQALAKYGSEKAARKWVAPPGRSQHNRGTAVDYALNGSLLRDASSPAAQWLSRNARKYGLDIPMSWEPWQVELAGARGRGAHGAVPVAHETSWKRGDAGLQEDQQGLREPPEFVKKGNQWLQDTLGVPVPTPDRGAAGDDLISLGMMLMNRGYF